MLKTYVAKRGSVIYQKIKYGLSCLAGDVASEANTAEVKNLRSETLNLKEVVAEQVLELYLLKKSMIGDGEDVE